MIDLIVLSHLIHSVSSAPGIHNWSEDLTLCNTKCISGAEKGMAMLRRGP